LKIIFRAYSVLIKYLKPLQINEAVFYYIYEKLKNLILPKINWDNRIKYTLIRSSVQPPKLNE